MRESSYTTKRNSHTPNDIRGGEKKVMKKGLSLLLAASMAVSAFSSAAMAAELTAQEKFDAMVKAGIFTGYEDGSAGLDRDMTRAEVATVVFRLLGLSEDAAGAAAYTDLVGAEWAAGYIGAITPEYMEGYGDGKFGPSDKFTYEQLAAVLVRVLDLDVDASASVEGTTSDWAKGYVAAAVAAGVLTAQTDYTKPALREALVASAYVANEKLNPPEVKEVAIASATQVGAKKLEVKFNQAVDTSKAVVSVKRGAIATNLSNQDWSEDKTTLTLEGFANFVAGDYTVSVTGLSDAALSQVIKVEASKVASIAFKGDKLILTGATGTATTAKVGYSIKNQFGEEINNAGVTAYTSAASVAAASGVATVTFGTAPAIDAIATVTLVDSATGVSAAGTFKVAAQSKVASYEFGELKNKDNKVLRTSTNVGTDKFQFDVAATDQYGLEITSATDLQADSLISTSNVALTAQFVTGSDNKPKLEVTGIPATAGTYNIIVVSKTSGKAVTLTVVVEKAISVASFNLVAPSDIFVVGETTYVPFEAVDQYGNVLTKYDDINPFVTLSDSDAHVTATLVKNPVTGEARVKVEVASTATADTTFFVTSIVTAEAKTSQISAKINAAAKPVRIAALKADSGVVTKLVKGGATTTIDAGDFQLKDQYERDISLPGAGFSIELTALDGTMNAVTLDDSDLSSGQTATVTAGANAGTETIVATLKEGANAVANSAVQVPVSVVEKSAIASYVIDVADKLYAPTGTTATTYAAATAAQQAYAKGISVYGQDANGAKIALVAGDIVNRSSTNSNLEFTGNNVFANAVADASKEESATIVVVVNGANGTATATKTITLTYAAPVAGDLVAKATSANVVSFADDVAVLTAAQMTAQNGDVVSSNKAGTRADVYFEVKDQYGVASAAVAPSYFTLSAKNAAGTAIPAAYSINATTGVLTVNTVTSGDEITITAIMNDGKTKSFKIIVE